MPKKAPTSPAPDSTDVSIQVKQYRDWKNDLQSYWSEMDKWQEMYEFYKSKDERSETDTNISLNTPFSLIESQIAKENMAELRITVKSKPDDDIGQFDRWVEGILHDAIEDPDVAELHGTFRKTKEKFSRALKVVGNAAAEIKYCYRTEIVDGEKQVIADNPYTVTRSYKSVIFNPAMQFDRSDIYYVEDHVSMSDLTSQEYKEEKDGSKKGLYKNLGELKVSLKKQGTTDLQDDSDTQYISGDKKISAKKKPITLITRWEGAKMRVIALTGTDEGIVIREATDPLKLGGHNLLLGMRYVVEGRPYAYGEIAAIYKPVRAQDTIVSQSIEIVNRYLRGSYILGSDMDIDQFLLVNANGGAMYGNIDSVKEIPVNTPPAAAFQQIDVLQQAIERAARFSLYDAGISGQSTDKTQGTKGGIEAIQNAATPNVQIQLDDIQEMFMQPVARKYLKMIGRLMGADEVRYGLLRGESPQWVKATKGILMGKATIADMVTVGLMDQEQALEYTTTMQPTIDPMTGQPQIDPMTGEQVLQQVPIPGAEEALVFDVDWIVDAKLDNQSAAEREGKTRAELEHVQWGMSIGVPIDPERAWVKIGKRSGFEDLEEIMLTPEEQQEQQMAMQQQQEAQMMQEQQGQQQQAEAEMQKQSMQGEQQMKLEAMKQQGNLMTQAVR